MEKFLENKPDISEWFENPPDSIPSELKDIVNFENSKVLVLSPDFAFIHDENLADVHALFNSEGGTWLFMNGRMDGENFRANNTGDNIKLICAWE